MIANIFDFDIYRFCALSLNFSLLHFVPAPKQNTGINCALCGNKLDCDCSDCRSLLVKRVKTSRLSSTHKSENQLTMRESLVW